MPLCIINVAEFKFDPPKISWDRTADSTVHSTGESHTIVLNTIYDHHISKILQKFNGTDWTDVADINTSYNVVYDGEGTDKYRLKATKRQKVLFSNELTIVKLVVPPIAFEGDPKAPNVSIKFTKKLPNNVKSYTLVVVGDNSEIQRYPNNTTFPNNNQVNKVYVEYEYNNGYKTNSNELEVPKDDNVDITWKDGSKDNKEGYDTSIGVEANKTGVSWEVYTKEGKWVKASFSNGKINLNEGVNRIRARSHRTNTFSEELVYNRRPLQPLSITWEEGGKATKTVTNGTNLAITLKPDYLQDGIRKKIMHIYIDGKETLKSVDNLSNMSFAKDGNIMEFKLKLHYDNNVILESNILQSKRLYIPKITWRDKTEAPKSGNENSVSITKTDLIYGHDYKLQRIFIPEGQDSAAEENWEDVDGNSGTVNTSQAGTYKFRYVSTTNNNLISNVLQYNRVASTKSGGIKWKGTDKTIVYGSNIPVEVKADPPEGGSYKILANTFTRDYHDRDIPEAVRTTEHNIGKPGSIVVENTITDVDSIFTTWVQGEQRIEGNRIIKNNVNNTAEVNVSEVLGFGLHYLRLVYTTASGESYDVGSPITAVVINNNLAAREYVYHDTWGISKQTPDHSIKRYEIKNSWGKENSTVFNYYGYFTPNPDNNERNIVLQKYRKEDDTWIDVQELTSAYFTFTKEEQVSKYRVKDVLGNGKIIYSNEVYQFYVGDILKFDTDKYYIVENIFDKKSVGDNLYTYTNIENTHTITATLLAHFTYQYQISINGGEFQDVGNTFTQDNPLNINHIFNNGYINGIVLIRLRCNTTLDNHVRYSNLIYAMLNGATMSWVADDNDNITETDLVGPPPYTFSIADIYRYKSENNGELKIYVNKTNPQETTYQQIIAQNQVIDTKDIAEDFTKSINPNIQASIKYSFTFYWVNSFAITHKGRSVITATWVNLQISVRYDNAIRIPYEVKTSYPESAEIYYDYQNPTIVLHGHVNSTTTVYKLERANLNSDDFTEVFTLPNRQNRDTQGDYIIDSNLSQGKYKIKQTVNNTNDIYTNIVTLYSFNDILKVNDTYAVFGFNNTVSDSGYVNQTEYNITYHLENYPENLRFKVQWCHSTRNILAGDTITTVDNKKVMSMNAFVDIGEEFGKTETVDIKQLVGRKNGLVRIRLKVLENNNIIGYSNVIWIYLDNSVSHFVDARVGNEDVRFPLYVEGDAPNGRLERLLSSRVFAIRCRHMYSDQRSDIYILTWNGTGWNSINDNDKYRRKLFTLTGNQANGDRNRDPNVYLYYRKIIIQPFNITLIPKEDPLEQVVMTSELINEARFVPESVLYGRELSERVHSLSGTILTSGVSSTLGNFRTLRYNNGTIDLPIEFILYESPINVENWSKYSGEFNRAYFDFHEGNVIKIPEVINVNNTRLKQRKFEYRSNRSIKNKIRIKYKNRYINETNAVSFYYFEPMLSMVQNRIGHDAVSYIYTTPTNEINQYYYGVTPSNNSVVVYANNVRSGFAYKFQIKKYTSRPGTIIIRDPTNTENNIIDTKGSRFILQTGFEFLTNFFTTNDRVTIRKERPNVDRHKLYALRLAIYNSRRDTLIGYSNVVYFENDDFFEPT